MSTTDWGVILGGLAAIAWVNWYFFLGGRRPALAAAGAAGPAGGQEVTVVVQGGYSPAHVRVKAGTPVRMVFDRRETSGCSEEVVIPEFGIRRFLPAHEKTAVEFTPVRAGTFGFTCGMSMLRGRLTVEE